MRILLLGLAVTALGHGYTATVHAGHALEGSTWAHRTLELRRQGHLLQRLRVYDESLTLTTVDVTGDGVKDVLAYSYTDGSGGCGTWRMYAGELMRESWVQHGCTDTMRVRLRPDGLHVWSAILSSQTKETKGGIHCCWRLWRHTVRRWFEGRLDVVARDVTMRPPSS